MSAFLGSPQALRGCVNCGISSEFFDALGLHRNGMNPMLSAQKIQGIVHLSVSLHQRQTPKLV